MLHSLSADQPQFKSLAFRPGLNIVLATRTSDSTKSRQRLSRNGSGKSSIVDLVHFLLGGKAEGAVAAEAVEAWNFKLELDVGTERVTVTRSPQSAKNLSVQSPWIGVSQLSNAHWCRHLGEVWFDLSHQREKGDVSYRQLFSYFARRKRDGALDDPVRTFRAQPAATTETALAYLFGLDSELVRRLHQTKAALKQARDAQKALAALDQTQSVGARRADLEAELEAQIAAVKLGRDRLGERIEAFNVLPAFRELESELARLNQMFRELSDADVLDQEAIDLNTQAFQAEASAEAPDLQRLFSEAQIIFPDLVADRYAEVQRFHAQLVENRKSHLQSEIAAAARRIADRVPQRENLEQRRREIARALRASGPADELLRLRDELALRESELKELEGRLTEARKLEVRMEELEGELEEVVRALRQDRRERAGIVEVASTTFSEISERLYEQPGSLAISATDSGLRFHPTTPSDGSAGVMSMEIFCFDLTIATLAQRRGQGPGFIIHDSHLFEPVDGRQFARALEIAAEFAEETGIQYIALLNSDELARAEQEAGVSFADYVLETTLADTPDGGLFGMRFD